MAIGIVIFDLDGTLFRTETVTVPAVREAFAHFALAPPSQNEICSCFGRTTEEYRAWLAAKCPPALAAAVEAYAVRRELELIPRCGELYPGVPHALAQLRDTLPRLAICSNGPRQYVRAVLEGCGIAPLFDAVRWRRPDDADKGRMLHDLLAHLAPPCPPSTVPLPGVLVGDRYDDVDAAHANGLTALGAAYGYGRTGELAHADATIDDPRDLARRVLGLLPLDDAR